MFKSLLLSLSAFLLISFAITSNAKKLEAIKVEMYPKEQTEKILAGIVFAVDPFYKANIPLPDGQVITITPDMLNTVITLPKPVDVTSSYIDVKVYAFDRTVEIGCPPFTVSGHFSKFLKTDSNTATIQLSALGSLSSRDASLDWIDISK